MDLQQLIESGAYINEFKKLKIIYRKYPELNLMIIKRKYGSPYSENTLWLNYCRGLVIDYVNHKIVFYPPIKSKEIRSFKDFVDIPTSSNYTELIDGTMINLFNYQGNWLQSSRSNIGCKNKWLSDINFSQMFSECSSKLDYNNFNKEYTYSFVMRHTKNRIITPIKENQLYLVEVRNKDNKVVLPIPECENNSYLVCKDIIRENLRENIFDHIYKGFTVTSNGIRYKWLTTECKFIEMIKPNTNNPLLNYLTLRNSGHLTNYLKLFPEERFKFNVYRNKVHELTRGLYQFYKNVFVYKQIEKTDIPFALNPLIYDIHGIYLKEKQGISWERIKQYIHELEPKKICFAINNL
jgi:hypothetical protein